MIPTQSLSHMMTTPHMCLPLGGGGLPRAGLVALQTVQDAVGQQPDVSVGLRVGVDQLQLLQAALLQQHAAVPSGCRDTSV